MRDKSSISLFTSAYNLARKARLLELPWFRRAFVSSYFLYKQHYEDPFMELVRRMPGIFRNGDILDIGANIGYTAWVFAGALRPGARVYAFEPDDSSFALLQEIIQRRKLSASVEALKLAVGNCDQSVEFWHNLEHSADHRVVTPEFRKTRAQGLETNTVAMTSVDSFVRARSLKNISFIKIDVQGYEPAVCEGMRQTLQDFPHTPVCLEYSPEGLQELGFEPGKVLDFFLSRGYQIYALSRGPILLAPDNASIERAVAQAGYVDLVCSKVPLLS